MTMSREYSSAEASEIIRVGEDELLVLRKKVGIDMVGKMTESNISAIKSYRRNVQGVPDLRPEEYRVCDTCMEEKPMINFPTRGRGHSKTCMACQTQEEDSSEQQTETPQIKKDEAPISKQRAKELVKEAYDLGFRHGEQLGIERGRVVNDSVGMLELLGDVS